MGHRVAAPYRYAGLLSLDDASGVTCSGWELLQRSDAFQSGKSGQCLKQREEARSEVQQGHVARSEVLLHRKLGDAFLAGIWRQEEEMWKKDRRILV